MSESILGNYVATHPHPPHITEELSILEILRLINHRPSIVVFRREVLRIGFGMGVGR